MKWLLSLLAFILLGLSLFSFTTNVFFSDFDSSYESTKENALKTNEVMADQIFNETINEVREKMGIRKIFSSGG